MKNKSGVSLITLIITIIVVIILAVIVLRSGASDAPDQATFSKFTSQMGELQDAVKVAMLEAKADELLEGNQRTEAQLYNFIARGGYEGFEYERKGLAAAFYNDTKWLTQHDAINRITSTQIEEKYAEESIGMKLPKIKVETAKGVEQKVSYFVTTKGTVFCWPPYVYEGKSYVNANTTVKSDTKVKNGIVIDFGSEEMDETNATKAKDNYSDFDDHDVIIAFDNDEYVMVQNKESIFTTFALNAIQTLDRYGAEDNLKYNVSVKNSGDSFIGVDFRYYDNRKQTIFNEDGFGIMPEDEF